MYVLVQADIQAKSELIEMKDKQIATKEKEVKDKGNEITAKNKEIARLNSHIQEQQKVIQTLRSPTEVNTIIILIQLQALFDCRSTMKLESAD